MVSTCLNELLSSNGHSDCDESSSDLAKELSMPKVDSSKLKRLLTRCVTPSNYGGPCPKPTFAGMQVWSLSSFEVVRQLLTIV